MNRPVSGNRVRTRRGRSYSLRFYAKSRAGHFFHSAVEGGSSRGLRPFGVATVDRQEEILYLSKIRDSSASNNWCVVSCKKPPQNAS